MLLSKMLEYILYKKFMRANHKKLGDERKWDYSVACTSHLIDFWNSIDGSLRE